MPLIDTQRRMYRTGAIRIGHKVPTGKNDLSGNPQMKPTKLDTFRVTSPHRAVIENVAQEFGGQIAQWSGAKGPEWEVITTARELPVLVPSQLIDPNYEAWGKNLKTRFCDGVTERLRAVPCLCRRWENHQHKWWEGKCTLCGLDQDWSGPPHEHNFQGGECTICGCGRVCKPTVRVNVMLQGVSGLGVFKVESHGINAATELSALADLIRSAPVPLPGLLRMRFENQQRIVIRNGREEIQARQFWVPELHFEWVLPELLFGSSTQLETAARENIGGTPVLQASGSSPAAGGPELTRDDVIHLAGTCELADLRQLWQDARATGVLDDSLAQILTDRGKELQAAADDAEVIVVND